MRVALGADHGGFETKEILRQALLERGIDFEDLGCFSKDSVDYPDYAREVSSRVSSREAEEGILICTTGIGMAIAANKFPGVRAALCLTADMAVKARAHNNANVLVLGGGLVSNAEALEILDAWFSNVFSEEERHARRIGKIGIDGRQAALSAEIAGVDPAIHAAIEAEEDHLARTINLIASENYVSVAVRQAQGSVMTNKYAEGYPGKRWYNGCQRVDIAESLAIDRAKQLFGAEHANVQPHCGSSANMAVYFAALEAGDTILAMRLTHGGHLTHGHAANFSGRFFKIVSYGVSPETEELDYDEVARLARENRPKLIVAGASSYPRILDFARFREIADEVGAMLMVDMAHIAGLVAGGAHPSPVPHAEFVTTTTHKTLRGPRSGMILCRKEYADRIDKQVFPGTQGGPQMHSIAAKAVGLHEAMQPDFAAYAGQIVANARAMAAALAAHGCRLVSGGTDTHLLLVDLSDTGLTGKEAAAALDRAGIIVNKNVIPFDKQSPTITSGIRIGTPAATTRGMKQAQMEEVADFIVKALQGGNDTSLLDGIRREVTALALRFPIP
jgi:RpiB/LacA/LacB family sugar-phosphate isomerase